MSYNQSSSSNQQRSSSGAYGKGGGGPSPCTDHWQVCLPRETNFFRKKKKESQNSKHRNENCKSKRILKKRLEQLSEKISDLLKTLLPPAYELCPTINPPAPISSGAPQALTVRAAVGPPLLRPTIPPTLSGHLSLSLSRVSVFVAKVLVFTFFFFFWFGL